MTSTRQKLTELFNEIEQREKALAEAQQREIRQGEMKKGPIRIQRNTNDSGEIKIINRNVMSLKRVFPEGDKETLYTCHRCSKTIPRNYFNHCKHCKFKTCLLCYG